jgi:hypothetical protein
MHVISAATVKVAELTFSELADILSFIPHSVNFSALKLVYKLKLVSRCRFVEQKLMLGSSFRCDLRYDFGHTVVLLKSDLEVKLSSQGILIEGKRRLLLASL